MTRLHLMAQKAQVELTQSAGYPGWTTLLFNNDKGELRFQFEADEFLVFLAWLDAEAKKIRSCREIMEEIMRKR